METLFTHVAGVDVHREKLVITTLCGDAGKEPVKTQFECATFTQDLDLAADGLLALGVRHVAMESTGIYWVPVFNVWHKKGIIITLANAAHLKNVPGRKTDMADSHWIAVLHRNGLIRPSYIAAEEFQELRALCRHRKSLIRDVATIKNRLLKVLENGNVKLAVVVSDPFAGSGLEMIRAMASGEKRAEVLMHFAGKNLKTPKEQIYRALTNCLTECHIFRIKLFLSQLDFLWNQIGEISQAIEQKMQPHQEIIEKLREIPGIDMKTAEVIVAEATTHMEAFPSDRHFAAWAGVAPGNNESAGRKKKCKVRRGNPALKEALVQAAKSASRKRGSYFCAKHRALSFRLGSANKATVAIANRMARLIFHIIKQKEVRYRDIGEERVEPRKNLIKKAMKKLENLGVKFSIQEILPAI